MNRLQSSKGTPLSNVTLYRRLHSVESIYYNVPNKHSPGTLMNTAKIGQRGGHHVLRSHPRKAFWKASARMRKMCNPTQDIVCHVAAIPL
jgi:hypothetical protein